MTDRFNTADVQNALGIKITADYIVQTLGVAPVETDKRAMFWTKNQVVLIAATLGNKMTDLADQLDAGDHEIGKAPAKPKKTAAPAPAPAPAPATKSAADLFDDDDDL